MTKTTMTLRTRVPRVLAIMKICVELTAYTYIHARHDTHTKIREERAASVSIWRMDGRARGGCVLLCSVVACDDARRK